MENVDHAAIEPSGSQASPEGGQKRKKPSKASRRGRDRGRRQQQETGSLREATLQNDIPSATSQASIYVASDVGTALMLPVRQSRNTFFARPEPIDDEEDETSDSDVDIVLTNTKRVID